MQAEQRRTEDGHEGRDARIHQGQVADQKEEAGDERAEGEGDGEAASGYEGEEEGEPGDEQHRLVTVGHGRTAGHDPAEHLAEGQRGEGEEEQTERGASDEAIGARRVVPPDESADGVKQRQEADGEVDDEEHRGEGEGVREAFSALGRGRGEGAAGVQALVFVELLDQRVGGGIVGLDDLLAEQAEVAAQEECIHAGQLAGGEGRGRVTPADGAVDVGMREERQRRSVA